MDAVPKVDNAKPPTNPTGGAAEAGMSGEPSLARVEIFRIVSEHFRQDISSFWNHATFYVVLQGALATVFATTVGPRDGDGASGLLAPSVLALVLALLGMLFSVAWWLAGQGRRKLIDAWRDQVVHQEALVAGENPSYAEVEKIAKKLPLEPTRVTAVVPVVLALAWCVATVWAATVVW